MRIHRRQSTAMRRTRRGGPSAAAVGAAFLAGAFVAGAFLAGAFSDASSPSWHAAGSDAGSSTGGPALVVGLGLVGLGGRRPGGTLPRLAAARSRGIAPGQTVAEQVDDTRGGAGEAVTVLHDLLDHVQERAGRQQQLACRRLQVFDALGAPVVLHAAIMAACAAGRHPAGPTSPRPTPPPGRGRRREAANATCSATVDQASPSGSRGGATSPAAPGCGGAGRAR